MNKLTLAIIGRSCSPARLSRTTAGIYDLQKQVLLLGRVAKVVYRNPHLNADHRNPELGHLGGRMDELDGLSRHGIRRIRSKSATLWRF